MRFVINMDVSDMKAAADFYQAAVGLTLNRIIGDEVAELTGGSATIYLLQKGARSDATQNGSPRGYSRHWTPIHIDFVVEDLEAAAKRALDAGAIREGGAREWSGSRWITFSDPFGHGFCLIEFAHGTYDA